MRRLPPKQKGKKGRSIDIGTRLETWAARIPRHIPAPICARARRVSLGLHITTGLAEALLLLAILANNISVVATVPDVFYLHDALLNDRFIMNLTQGTATATKLINTAGQRCLAHLSHRQRRHHQRRRWGCSTAP